MSWRAMEAVQDHSRYQTRQKYYEFRVMLALASFADERGVIGVEGQYEACPSQTAVAERAHVHRNTVNKVLPRLLADGELVVAAQGGSGRGTWAVYQIMLPMEPGDWTSGVQLREESAHGSRELKAESAHRMSGAEVPFMEEIAHGMQEMAHEIAHLRALIAHGISTNSTRFQRERVQDPILDPMDPVDPGDPDARANGHGEESPPLPTPTGVVGEGDGEGLRSGGLEARGPKGGLQTRPYSGDDATVRRRAAVQGTAKAIAEVCGLDMRVDSHRARCEEAALQLAGAYPGDGFGEATILARYGPPRPGSESWNWYRHDWRGRKGEQPEPRWVVETIRKEWQGEGVEPKGRQDAGAPTSNNEATARRYAELRRKFMED